MHTTARHNSPIEWGVHQPSMLASLGLGTVDSKLTQQEKREGTSMKILVRPLKHILAVLGVLSLALVLLSGTPQKAHASPQQHERPQDCPAPGSTPSMDRVIEPGFQQGYIDLETWTYNCSNYWPSKNDTSYAFVTNCASQTYNVNADAWMSQGTVPGATRYNETGRSGYWAIPNDCNLWKMRTTSMYTWPPSPFYGCSWFNVYELNITYDYVCVRIS